jgi:squalene synthase HpnC
VTELSPEASADAYCRMLANRHYENFTVASLVVPARYRLHLARIYAFCRTTDDLGDESRGDGSARLAEWRQQVEQMFRGDVAPVHPVLLALHQSVKSFGMTEQPFLDLIDANVQDQTVREYQTWNELLSYCQLSAAPVGRMVLAVFGVDDAGATAFSDDVCIGLQLANFAQDVKRDKEIGRTYLVQEDILSSGIAGAVREHCDRADALLSSGRELERMVPRRLGVQLSLYRMGGEAIVSAVRQTGYRTDQTRPRVSSRDKARILAVALLRRGGKAEHARARHIPESGHTATYRSGDRSNTVPDRRA